MKLKAFDCEDVAVIAAALQGAVVKVADMAFAPRHQSFAMLVNRFRWEEEGPGDACPSGGSRVRCGVRFGGVLSVRALGFRLTEPDTVLELLTISCKVTDSPAAELTLIFAGGFKTWLKAECVELTLEDIGQAWETPNRPDYGLEDKTAES